jgi:hypothetical protein
MDIETEISTFVEENYPIVVNSNNDLTKATTCIKGIKSMCEKVKSSFDPIVDKAHKAHKEAIGQRDKYLKPLLELEKRFKDAILVFNRKMEEEQKERIRLANERMAKEAEEKKQNLLEEAKKTDDAWEKEELNEKAQAIAPVTCDASNKAIESEGMSIRKTWKARVIDINLIPREYLIIEANMSALNQHARNNREVSIEGVEFYEDSSVSTRA